MILSLPNFALRMIPHPKSGREFPSPYHFQNPRVKNRTACGKPIASWRGDIHTNKAWGRMAAKRERWERTEIINVPNGQMCGVCLGAMTVDK